MLAVSAQNIHRGKESDIYAQSGTTNLDGTITTRNYSEEQSRIGAHLKLDFLPVGEHHKLAWYNGYMF